MINQDQIIHLLQKEIYHISNVKVESITENLLSDRLGIDLVYFLYVFSNFKESTGIPVHNIFRSLSANEFTLQRISELILAF